MASISLLRVRGCYYYYYYYLLIYYYYTVYKETLICPYLVILIYPRKFSDRLSLPRLFGIDYEPICLQTS